MTVGMMVGWCTNKQIKGGTSFRVIQYKQVNKRRRELILDERVGESCLCF
jgi:hypothetical protein